MKLTLYLKINVFGHSQKNAIRIQTRSLLITHQFDTYFYYIRIIKIQTLCT